MDVPVLSSLLDNLNADQRLAVETFDRPVLVLAGSGTGKTHLLVAKFLAAVQRGIAPERIMAVTFTRKAAQELRARVAKYLPLIDPAQLWIGTFHSLSSRILRASPNMSPIGTDFTTLEQADLDMVIAQILRRMNHEAVNGEKALKRKVKEIGQLIEQIKNEGASIPTILEQNRHDLETAGILREYEKYLRDRSNADFGDLIVGVIEMIAKSPTAAQAWKNRWDLLIVDEYQDVNTAQGRWTEALMRPGMASIFAGDDDQVIYQWRGANPDYILNFGMRFNNAEIITLQTNYRSPQPIVDAARRLIGNNLARYNKTVEAHDAGGADTAITVHAHGFTDQHNELITALQMEAIAFNWNEMMVLTRTNSEAGMLANELKKAGIPVNLVRQSASESRTMELLMAWLRVLKNPNDVPAFARCIGFREDDPVLRNLWMRSMMLSKTIIASTREQVESGKITEEGVVKFMMHYDAAIAAIAGLPPIDALQAVFDHCGFIDRLDNVVEDERIQFLMLFQELCAIAQCLRTFEEIADHIQTEQPSYSKPDGVMVSTMHGVKGLEAPIVCATGWSARKFPRSLNDHDIEEQRRLAFVTVTRSSHRVHLFYDRAEGPSPFIIELGV